MRQRHQAEGAVYKTTIISTIVDAHRILFSPSPVYKTTIISTIVDFGWNNLLSLPVYKTTIISTIVDLTEQKKTLLRL